MSQVASCLFSNWIFRLKVTQKYQSGFDLILIQKKCPGQKSKFVCSATQVLIYFYIALIFYIYQYLYKQ